jgi:TolA-binding protein
MLREEPGDKSLAELAGLARMRLGGMSDVQQARGMRSAISSFASTPAERLRFSPRRLLVAAAAVLLLAGTYVGLRLWRQAPLTFALDVGEIQAGGYFRAGAGSRPSLTFSDGSRIDLLAGARGRVAAVDAQGARVLLDEGEASVHVVPRTGARWQFDAGPFAVKVHGTRFGLAWRGDEGRLDLRLHEGAISVSGPLLDQLITLRPGQWLTVRLAGREVFVRDFDPAAPPALAGAEDLAPAAPVPAPPAAADAPPSERPRPAIRAATPPAESREAGWAPARSEADWQRILDLAHKHGLKRTLAERGSDDLALLADAAHYLHRDDIAEQTLLALRRRFAGTARGQDAAFLLGRIVESKTGGANEALTWYERHLAEAPEGAYASDALGRKMTLLARLRGGEAARPVAQEYLRRFPGGTYARAARVYADRP